MAGKQYEVLRSFRRVDPKSGDVSTFEVGDTYSGPIESEDAYLGREGPDGLGPLVRDKSAKNVESPEVLPSIFNSASDSSKGK